MDESRVAADEIDPDRLGSAIECPGIHRVVRRVTGCGHHRDRGDGDAFVDDRDTELMADVLARFDEVFRFAADFIIDALTGPFGRIRSAIEQVDPHCDRAHIEVLLTEHAQGFQDFEIVKHGVSP